MDLCRFTAALAVVRISPHQGYSQNGKEGGNPLSEVNSLLCVQKNHKYALISTPLPFVHFFLAKTLHTGPCFECAT